MNKEQKTKNKDTTRKAHTEAPSASNSMHVKVYSPFKVYFDEEAESISAVNDTGAFDILPSHHNFMTLLSAGEILIRATRGEQKIRISRGIMHVKADKVIVFLDV